MSFINQLFGRRTEPCNDSRRGGTPRRSPGAAGEQLTDEQAVERYRYLLRTASPEEIEQAHAEAFAQLTPDQRRLVLEGLSGDLPPQERTGKDDPQSLARMATRAELRWPGTLERTFGGTNRGGSGIGSGGFIASNLFSTIAGVVIGSAIAEAIFDDGGDDQGDDGDAGGTDTADAGYDGDSGYDAGGDIGGDFGGDGFGGGDFGGGEF